MCLLSFSNRPLHQTVLYAAVRSINTVPVLSCNWKRCSVHVVRATTWSQVLRSLQKLVSDIAIFVLKRDVKLELTLCKNQPDLGWGCLRQFPKYRQALSRLCTARRSYASAVLGVEFCPSICLSVRLSYACFVTNPKNLPAIFLYHMKGQSF